MKIVNVNLKEHSYPIYIGYDMLDKIGLYAAKKTNIKNKIVIITNSKVGKLYLDNCLKSFKKYGFNTYSMSVPDGEKFKNIEEATKIYKKLIKFKADRNSVLVALGGGVIGDLVGFVAATYLRGVSLIQIPTTLLAQVDSSVGGKVAVNLPEGKNLIGAFYQPKMVFIDCAVLTTLPKREIKAGLAEVIKYGIIKDAKFFNFLEKNLEEIINLNRKFLEEIISTSCKIKACIVEKDEKETDLRRILNFGHTIGHSIETETKYKKYKHGEAVAIGMVGAMKLSEKFLSTKKSNTERVINLLKKAELPVEIKENISKSNLMKNIALDKKVIHEKIIFVLTKDIGHAIINSIFDKGLVASVICELLN
ncbi:3-dehydroquinate synthase [Candidatus Poribacteria bacterium]|nr:3-dehydroquinate synthase [Candidatus Poribacteria bacterium]